MPPVKETAPGPLLVPQATLGRPAPGGLRGAQQVLRDRPGDVARRQRTPCAPATQLGCPAGAGQMAPGRRKQHVSLCASLPPGQKAGQLRGSTCEPGK